MRVFGCLLLACLAIGAYGAALVRLILLDVSCLNLCILEVSKCMVSFEYQVKYGIILNLKLLLAYTVLIII